MQLRSWALAALTLAGGAYAQCGANQIVTPPNYAANNGGAVGGAVFFSLVVTATNGVSICGIDVNTDIPAAIPIAGQVRLHNTEVHWQNLTSGNTDPSNWTTVACLSGTSAGLDNPSTMSITNTTNSLDLAKGSYCVAIVADNFNHVYTNGDGSNQVVADLNLVFQGGSATNSLGTGVFNPRVFNGGFDYDVPGSSVTTSASFSCSLASCSFTGSGCGAIGVAAQLYEDFSGGNPFDLADDDMDFVGTGAGGGVSSAPLGQTAIIPPVAPDLGLGDDEVSGLIALGFDLGSLGLPCIDSIAVCSNGFIWLGEIGSSDFSESASELHNQGPRFCPLWDDFRPGAGGGGGTIHVDIAPNIVLVTWLNIEYWTGGGGGPTVSFQCEITPGGFRTRYDPGNPFNDDGIVGFSNGFSQAVTPSSDLDAGAIGPFASSGVVDLALGCTPSLPGGNVGFHLSNIPDDGIGTLVARFGPGNPGVALPNPPLAAGCSRYVNTPNIGFPLILNADQCVTYTFNIAIPGNPVFIGLIISAQGVGFNPSTGLLSTSNGAESTVGNYL